MQPKLVFSDWARRPGQVRRVKRLECAEARFAPCGRAFPLSQRKITLLKMLACFGIDFGATVV
jgi:hypothetical protein